MFKKVILIITVMTLAAALLTGCGKSDSGKTTGSNIIKLENGNAFDVDSFCNELDDMLEKMDLEFEITPVSDGGYKVNVTAEGSKILTADLAETGIRCDLIAENVDTDDLGYSRASLGLASAMCWYKEVYGESFDKDDFIKVTDAAWDEPLMDEGKYLCRAEYKDAELEIAADSEAGTMFITTR